MLPDDLEPMSPQESWTCEQCGHILDVYESCPVCQIGIVDEDGKRTEPPPGVKWVPIGEYRWSFRMDPDRGWSVHFIPGRCEWVALHPGPHRTTHLTLEDAKARCEEEKRFQDAVDARIKEEFNAQ